MDRKRCSICGELKPRDAFNYEGLIDRAYCQDCRMEDRRIRRTEGIEAVRAWRENMRESNRGIIKGKRCSICGEWKPGASFIYSGRELTYCQDCRKEDGRLRRKEGKEAVRAWKERMRASWKW
jgi:hypothetical protein